MDEDQENGVTRRQLLTATSVAASGLGAVAAAVPFVVSMQPSERAKAMGAPVEVDISRLDPGHLMVVEWRGKPVWILKRTEEMIERIKQSGEQLRDPDSEESIQPGYVDPVLRSIEPTLLVMVGICTHLGCSPTFRPEQGDPEMGHSWDGGFFRPCHGSKFDLAGRVFAGVPAPTNMTIPPYYLTQNQHLVIGEDPNNTGDIV